MRTWMHLLALSLSFATLSSVCPPSEKMKTDWECPSLLQQ
jgi:hypothetical protein